MKFILVLIITFFTGIVSGQNGDVNNGMVNNQGAAFKQMASAGFNSYGTIYLNNPSKDIKGSVYLFDSWNNQGVIYLDDKQRFVLRNININIQRNSFDSKISQDSIYTFNTNNIVKFIINNVTYKNLYSDKGKRIYEMIYESEDFAILKGFNIRLISGSVNPMVNRPDDKYSRSESYFLKEGNNTIRSYKLNKKRVLKLISDDKDRLAKLEAFMHDNNLSYRNSNDVKKALKFSMIN